MKPADQIKPGDRLYTDDGVVTVLAVHNNPGGVTVATDDGNEADLDWTDYVEEANGEDSQT